MTRIVHHLPGRLRLRVEVLKNDGPALAALAELLAGRRGVTRVETNPLTAGLLVAYDPARTSAVLLLQALVEMGYDAAVPCPPADLAGRLGEAAVGFVVDRLVERSAFALLGVLV
jgi:hypothetical protein